MEEEEEREKRRGGKRRGSHVTVDGILPLIMGCEDGLPGWIVAWFDSTGILDYYRPLILSFLGSIGRQQQNPGCHRTSPDIPSFPFRLATGE